MEYYWGGLVKNLMFVLIVLLQIQGHSNGCFLEERMGLLEIKAFLPSNDLSSWIDERESDCCGWERVTCNATTGHVIHLSLNSTVLLFGPWAPRQPLLNVSLFRPFKELRSLDLSDNGFEGSIENEGFERLSVIRKFETLVLDNNTFNNSIFPSLSALTSLKTLRLRLNALEGSIPAQALATLENLQVLDLGENLLNGTLTTQDSKSLSKLSKLKYLDLSDNNFRDKEILRLLGALPALKSLRLGDNGMPGCLSNQDFETFSNLEILDLSSNELTGSISPFIGSLSSLKALSLAQNSLNGSLPIRGLCQLKKLEELDLSHNSFKGILSPCLSNLTSLRLLDLSENIFTGSISSSLISGLTSLEYIDLSNNLFKGLFSFSSFANHSKLEMVSIISEGDEFEVETESLDWVPMFQLEVLRLPNCKLDKLTEDRHIPKFLLSQHELRVVDLSHNNLKGKFPNWLLENNTRLELLNLRNNSLMGQFLLQLYSSISIIWLDVSSNQIGRTLQENIGEMVPYTIYLNLSINSFEGNIPTSISSMSGLKTLDLSFNKFSGEVPVKLLSDCVQLTVLKLSRNNLHGQIFSTHFSLTDLRVLNLANNRFTGTLSNVIFKCSLLSVLDIGNNNMSGEIHSGIGRGLRLFIFSLRNNSFEGLFPCELMSSWLLDLSHNSFSGSLPQCSNLQELHHLHLQDNNFTGPIPKAYLNFSRLQTLDISDNFLSGSLPNLIGRFSDLRILLLRGNHLNGLIPLQLCQLNQISLMDLSKNSFFGSIPHCFNNITFGNKNRLTKDVFTTMWYKIFYPYQFSITYRSLLEKELDMYYDSYYSYSCHYQQDEATFITKYRDSAYKGTILNYMSGLDLSSNKLTGEIPHELGSLTNIHALNLSHNQLKGSIPTAFSKLTQIESLDLSYNSLSGEIPSELIDLHFLEVFTVAHNNLSGRVPDRKAQFGTFENSSYEGNPFLCGPPLEKSCTTTTFVIESPTTSSYESGGKWYEIDPVAFFASFGASFIVFLLGVVTILYINPYWRRRWFYFIEECFYSCYYFVVNTLYKLSVCFHN